MKSDHDDNDKGNRYKSAEWQGKTMDVYELTWSNGAVIMMIIGLIFWANESEAGYFT